MQILLHVKVGNKLKKRMQLLVNSGLFNNNVEIVREGLRDVLSGYSDKQPLKKKQNSNTK